MDTPEYNCGVRQEENKNHKLANSYMIAVDSGFESIYNGCSSVLMEKSFSRESFDIFSPNSSNRSPITKCHSSLKYRMSTPKSSASIKRHLYSSFNSSSQKRSKSENNENEPMTVNTSIHYKPDLPINSVCPVKGLHKNGFSPSKNILSSTTNHHQLSFINDSTFSMSKHLTRYEEEEGCIEQPIVPQRPSKCLRSFTPSGKNSKRKLDIPPVDNKEPGRKFYFNGTRYLNIISKLEQYTLILEEIFRRLSGKELLNVSLVSKNWNSIVKSNRNANARILQYLNESRNFKENLKEITKPPVIHKRNPFSQFNNISTSKKTQDSSFSSIFSENQNVVQHLFSNERLVKCPRCSRGSIITNSQSRLHSTSCISIPSSDLTFLNKQSDSICDAKLREYNIDKEKPQDFGDYGICTSIACKFMFCPKCLCDYHPGSSCQISEPESPSKLIVCHKKLKAENKSKISSKRQSLRRLCFS